VCIPVNDATNKHTDGPAFINLKTELEGIGITKDSNTITSIDIEAMYPNVMFSHIEDAVEYFLRDSPEEDIKEARKCLELVKSGMNLLVPGSDV